MCQRLSRTTPNRKWFYSTDVTFTDTDVPDSSLSSLVRSPSSQSHQIISSRVRVESQELSSHFESLVCKFESMSSQKKFSMFPMFSTAKWRPTSYKLANSKLRSASQCCFSIFVTRLLNLKYLVKAVCSFHFTLSFNLNQFHRSSLTLLQQIYLLISEKPVSEKKRLRSTSVLSGTPVRENLA